jgi:XTP/dITP diphosphohydrolase
MNNSQVKDEFGHLVAIMDELREKCPWDQKQTIESLRSLTIEETYELADAITREDWKGISEELGDLLLHIVFYSRIGKEEGRFTIEEVIHKICEKLIHRHPHIYGNVQVRDEEDVKKNWEKLKMKEGKDSVLGGIPVSLPATVKAIRLQEKAKQVGFEWEQAGQVWEKVEEEMRELQEAVGAGLPHRIEEEFGDLIFSLINYARFLRIDAESSLEKTNKKFTDRFVAMEKEANASGRRLTDMSLSEMDAIWDSIKKKNSED